MFNNSIFDIGLHNENKREFFRVYLDIPLCSQITLLKINGQEINMGYSNVCINDIGPGGLLFTSDLDFPIKDNISFKFKTKLLNSRVLLEGQIVRKIIVNEGIFKYGVSFEISEEKRAQCIKLLNDVAIGLRRNAELRDCSFCTKESFEECFKKINK